MSQAPRLRKPIAPMVIIVVGCLVGAVGLWLLLVGTGVLSPPVTQVAGIDVDVHTATPGIIVMVLGFGTALTVALLTSARGATHPRATGRRRREAPLESLNEMPTRQTFDLLNERPPYFS